MKKTLPVVYAVLFAASLASAEGPKTYRVTGPVLELKGDLIVVRRGRTGGR